MSKSRIEIFSDAVLAIVLTLLVLDLRAPDIHSGASLHEYAIALAPLLPKLLSFILSFVVISIYWVNHHNFFHYIQRSTTGLVWVNMLLLLALCLLPFPTSLIGAHPTDQFPVILYSVNLLFCASSFYLLRRYSHGHHLLAADCEQLEQLSPRQSYPAIAIFSLAIILSFVNVYAALFCLVFFPIFYWTPKGTFARNSKM